MNEYELKAEGFLNRLLSNPTLNGFSPLQKEEQILQFLFNNRNQLLPTLSSAAFFKDKSWDEIWKLLTAVLFNVSNKDLLPAVKKEIETINYSFLDSFEGHYPGQEKIKEALSSFVIELLANPNSRRVFTGFYHVFKEKIIDKYVDEVFRRREYVHFEIAKVQKLNVSKEAVANIIKLSVLLRPGISLFPLAHNIQGQQNKFAGLVNKNIVDKARQQMLMKINIIPEKIILSALNSNLSFTENNFIEATGRIAYIFISRLRSLKPVVNIDRGADSPDKSWFSISRRNFKFYGYDVKMLDEFYKIAAENGW